MKKWMLVAAVLIAAVQYFQLREDLRQGRGAESPITVSAVDPPATATGDSNGVARAFSERRSNVQVEAEGVVARVLAEDNDGSRHQRFLVRLGSGQTVLIAHNIDLAPRIDGLRQGDGIVFAGEYEWNERGGVIHWTHRDPAGRHIAGWLRHNGRLYQ